MGAGPVGLGILWILHEIKLNGFEIIGLLKTERTGEINGDDGLFEWFLFGFVTFFGGWFLVPFL